MKFANKRAGAFGATLVAGMLLMGCAGPGTSEAPPKASAPSVTPTPHASEPAATGGTADIFTERDAFMREQQLPTDGSNLVAVTDAQKAFIAEERAFLEKSGGTWTAQNETLLLALTADACETSILNRHAVDATVFQTHVASSPLFATLIPADITGEARTAAERNVSSLMVNGTKYMCPKDAEQWSANFAELYPAP